MERSTHFVRPALSMKDDDVPIGYVSIYNLFVLSDRARKYFGIEKAMELRKKSFENILGIFEEYGAYEYDKFWNMHIDKITELGLNEFAKFEPLKPYCYYIEAFVKTVKVGKVKKNRVSFGIDQNTLTEYFRLKEEAKAKGTKFIPPKSKNKRYTNKDFIKYGFFEFTTGEEPFKKTRISRNAIFKQFEDWCRLKKMRKRDACFLAIKTLMEQKPVENLKELESYEVITILDQDFVREKPEEETVCLQSTINAKTHNKMSEIIARFNGDPKNKHLKRKTQKQYVEEAINLMNKSVPLKYSDPQLYKEYLELEKQKLFAEALELEEKDGK